MTDIPDNTVLRVVASMLLPDQVIAQNVFYLMFKDTGASADADDLLSDLVDYIEGVYYEFRGYMNTSAIAAGIQVYMYDAGDDDWDEVGALPWADSFADAGEMLPHGASVILHAKTTDPDVQATKYIPTLGESACENSDLSPTGITAAILMVVDWVQDDVGALTGGDLQPGVWSPTNSAFFHFNNVGVVNHIIGYQRRRKPGVGI